MAIEFTSDNSINISAFLPGNDPDADGSDVGTFQLDWDEDPLVFAQQLRAAADFIEHHAANTIIVEVD